MATANRRVVGAGVLFPERSYQIMEAFYRVYNGLGGCAYPEKTYVRALRVDFNYHGIPWRHEVRFPAYHLGVEVGSYRCDLLVDDAIIIEAKVRKRILDEDVERLLRYLRTSKKQLGILLNFGPRPSYRRIVCTTTGKRPAR